MFIDSSTSPTTCKDENALMAEYSRASIPGYLFILSSNSESFINALWDILERKTYWTYKGIDYKIDLNPASETLNSSQGSDPVDQCDYLQDRERG